MQCPKEKGKRINKQWFTKHYRKLNIAQHESHTKKKPVWTQVPRSVNWTIHERYVKQYYDFNFPIVNFSFMCSNILAALVYGAYIFQLIRYSRACGSYQDFLDRWLLLTKKATEPSHNFESVTISSMTWVVVTEYLCHKWPRICSVCRNHNSVLSWFMTYHKVCHKSTTMGATFRAATAYPSAAPEFIPLF